MDKNEIKELMVIEEEFFEVDKENEIMKMNLHLHV